MGPRSGVGVMGAVRMLAAARRRGRRPALGALVALVGIAGGLAIAVVAGARRTDSAFARFERTARAATFEIDAGTPSAEQLRAFARTPGVEGVGVLRQIALYQPDLGFLPTAGPVDGSWGHVVDRRRLLRGRRARGPLELEIGEGLARRLGIDVGHRLVFSSFTQAQIDSGELEGGDFVPRGPDVEFGVVGIVRHPLDLGVRGEAGGVVVPTRAFVEEYGDRIGSFSGLILRVRTAHGEQDAARVARAARAAFGADEGFRLQPLGIEGRSTRDAVGVAASALWILGSVLVLAGIATVGFTVARLVWADADDEPALRAVGMRRLQRWVASVAVVVPVAVGGALIAGVVAVLASPAFPIGVARDAEPAPGVAIDATVLVAGTLAVAAVVVVVAAAAGWAVTRRPDDGDARSAVAGRVVASTSLSPPAVAGIGFALERGRGRRAVPVWSSVAVMTVGVLGVSAALVFGSGLRHLTRSPAAYGWTWDVSAFGTDHLDDPCPTESAVTAVPGVGAVASLCYRDIEVAGLAAQMWAFQPVRGDIGPTIVGGRAPATAREIALGRDLLDAARLAIGDRVRVETDTGPVAYRVVGQFVMPGLEDPLPLAGSAVVTPAGIRRAGGAADDYTVLRVRPGADRDRVRSVVQRRYSATDARLATVPTEIERVRQVDAIPLLVAAATAALGLAAVAFTLVLSIRRRAREIAVLKTLGFVRGQVQAAVAWQASTLACIGLVVGLGLGLVTGRLAWRAVADGLGVSGAAHVPWLALALLGPVVLVLVNLIAAFPARAAARTAPAVALRSE